jgi:2'-5' RNA ligase
VRLFAGLPAPPPIQALWADRLSRLKRSGPHASWVVPENLHITLKFLGETGAHRLEEITAALKEAAAPFVPVALPFEGVGFFPHERKPRVLILRYHRDPALVDLFGRVEDRLAPLGYARERRPFEVHLTLARLRRPWPPGEADRVAADLGTIPWPPFPAAGFVLFESILSPAGAVYIPLGRFPEKA